MGKGHNRRWQPFLMTIQLANLNRRFEFAVKNIDARQGNILAKQRRAHGGCDLPNLRTTNMNTIAMHDINGAVDFQTYKFA